MSSIYDTRACLKKAFLELLKKLGNNHVDVTIGSALDLFGGKMKFEDVLAVCRR